MFGVGTHTALWHNSQLTQDILILTQHPHCPFPYVNIGKTLSYML